MCLRRRFTAKQYSEVNFWASMLAIIFIIATFIVWTYFPGSEVLLPLFFFSVGYVFVWLLIRAIIQTTGPVYFFKCTSIATPESIAQVEDWIAKGDLSRDTICEVCENLNIDYVCAACKLGFCYNCFHGGGFIKTKNCPRCKQAKSLHGVALDGIPIQPVVQEVKLIP